MIRRFRLLTFTLHSESVSRSARSPNFTPASDAPLLRNNPLHTLRAPTSMNRVAPTLATLQPSLRQPQQCGPCPHTRRAGLLHLAPALPHQPHRIAETQTARRYQRRVLAEAVSRHEIRSRPALLQNSQRRNRDREQRG